MWIDDETKRERERQTNRQRKRETYIQTEKEREKISGEGGEKGDRGRDLGSDRVRLTLTDRKPREIETKMESERGIYI